MPLTEVELGVELYYEATGDGSPLVFVHEFAGSYRSWDEQIENLRSDFRTIVYNCRGYPPSSVPDDMQGYSQDRSIADLDRLLTALDFDRVALVGLSMGGNIALNFSLRYPERVRRLVVAVTGSGSEPDPEFLKQFDAVAGRLEREGVRPVADDYLTGPTRIQLKRKRPEIWRKQYEEFCALSPWGLANTIRGAILPRPPIYALERQLKDFPVPTLVIAGDEDEPTVKPSRYIAQTVPHGELEIFENTGHAVNLEEPERFNNSVARFLVH